MATLTKRIRNGSTMYEVQWYSGGTRKTIPLGKKFTEKTAKELLDVVEVLLHCKTNGIEYPGKKTVSWIETASPEIRKKLGKAGLIEVPEMHTLKELWDTFLAQKTGVKESTLKHYGHVKAKFFEFFEENELVENLTPERMLQWKTHLFGCIAKATVAGYIKETKTCLNWAVKNKWIEKSPLTGIGTGSFTNKAKDRIISMEDYYKLLDKCPCLDWRVIISLCRIGGLRCPSEVLALKWSDINWACNNFTVCSPKTAHHEGKDKRIVPIFGELYVELRRLFEDESSERQEFIINRYRSATQNLGTTFQKIVKRAGLSVIPRPFDNMRMTRSNEIYNKFGAFKESMWIGHSARVRQDHYLMIQDSDYTEAVQWKTSLQQPNFPAIQSKRQQVDHEKKLEIVG